MQELTDGRLHKEILRLEYEKPRLVEWTQYDEDRLLAYRELEELRRWQNGTWEKKHEC